MTDLDIGPGQMKVLRVLWEKKRVTAQEMTNILNATEPIKFSTVSTFLRSLVKKGVAKYDVADRTYIYYPVVQQEKVANHAVRGLIDHMFAGSTDGFVSFILKSGDLSSDELEKVRALVEDEQGIK